MTIEAEVIKPPQQAQAKETAPRLDEILWFRRLMEKSASVDAAGYKLTGDELRIAMNGGFELFALQIGGILGSNRNGREGNEHQERKEPHQSSPRLLAEYLREAVGKIKDGIVNFCRFDPSKDDAQW